MCVVRIFGLLVLSAACVARLSAQHPALDPAFENVPFEQWLGEHDAGRFHWSVKVPRAELSFHQRLISSIDVRLDGQDLDTRRADGKLLLLIQVTDAAGNRYREHGEIDLSKVDKDVKEANLDYSQRAFLLPGEYQLAVALFDKTSGEHSLIQQQFRMPPAHDFLMLAWRGLPAVEFIGNDVSPESWYLPYIQGRLQWAESVRSPARLNVILNLAPSRRASSAYLAALLPSLKVMSQTGSPALSERVALLDLSRRRTVFDQNDVNDLDWPRLKSSLGEANTASIDVHSLGDRHEDAQFFVSEVRRVLRASADKPCVLVVLTKPISFDSGEDLDPVSLEALPPCRVVYLRYHFPPPSIGPMVGPQMGGRGRRSRMGDDPLMRNRPMQDAFDQLEATLKPLSPKVIDVETPEQVTKALTEIEKALLK